VSGIGPNFFNSYAHSSSRGIICNKNALAQITPNMIDLKHQSEALNKMGLASESPSVIVNRPIRMQKLKIENARAAFAPGPECL